MLDLLSVYDSSAQFFNHNLHLYFSLLVQLRDLERGVDILVATPGRLVDLLERENPTILGISVYIGTVPASLFAFQAVLGQLHLQTVARNRPAQVRSCLKACVAIMNSKKKAVLDRFKHLEDAVAKAREYLQSGKQAHWQEFRPLFVDNVRNGKIFHLTKIG